MVGDSDKRRRERVVINREFASVADFVAEYAMNLSRDGAFIRTVEILPVGTLVDLRFTVIVEDFETIEGEGRVVRVVEAGDADAPGIGVVFTSLTPRSREVLARLSTRPAWGGGRSSLAEDLPPDHGLDHRRAEQREQEAA